MPAWHHIRYCGGTVPLHETVWECETTSAPLPSLVSTTYDESHHTLSLLCDLLAITMLACFFIIETDGVSRNSIVS